MTGRINRITQALRQSLEAEHVVVDDVSGGHARGGDATHLNITVVSHVFDNLSRVRRHQRVYALLRDELETGLHAVTITTKTLTEHRDGMTTTESPGCVG